MTKRPTTKAAAEAAGLYDAKDTPRPDPVQATETRHVPPATPATAAAPKALTVKVPPDDYRRLRLFAVEHDMTHQDIMLDALRQYLQERR